MKSIDEINEEGKQFAREWKSQQARIFVSIFAGAALLGVFSPSALLEYVAAFTFIVPIYLWAFKIPKGTKHRLLVSILCIIAATALYIGVISGS